MNNCMPCHLNQHWLIHQPVEMETLEYWHDLYIFILLIKLCRASLRVQGSCLNGESKILNKEVKCGHRNMV
jgi:hypothetical protein